ncbi:MAG: type II toxin-antitoxin system HicA family toxin [Bacteroidetes bacterium]|nr:type II toxin-antitoxin system HicA family toxin [Bacteroidota bacterium]
MRIPRDISGQELIRVLKSLGYTVTRQTGSHIRLTTANNGEHHLTIPNHDPIKIGTLSAILSDVATHFKTSKEDIVKQLWA